MLVGTSSGRDFDLLPGQDTMRMSVAQLLHVSEDERTLWKTLGQVVCLPLLRLAKKGRHELGRAITEEIKC